MQVDFSNENFITFYESLVAYGGNSTSYEDTDIEYYLSRYWGKKFDKNRLFIWCAPLDETYGDLTIDGYSFSPYYDEGGEDCLSGDTLLTMADGTKKEM